jgi:hypothetical protein
MKADISTLIDNPCPECGRGDLCDACAMLEEDWQADRAFFQLASACPELPSWTIDQARRAYTNGGLFTLLHPILCDGIDA